MPAVINYKICDLVLECGCIEKCPTKAFFWDNKKKRPAVDVKKCTDCGICTIECPAGAVLLARNSEELQKILEMIKNDPRSEEWLWRERYGVQPGRTPPHVKKVTPQNFEKEVLKAKGIVALDVWHTDFLDCRVHSALYEEIKPKIKKFEFKKIDAKSFPRFIHRLKVNKFPSLLIFYHGRETGRIEGLRSPPYDSFKVELQNKILEIC